MPAQNVANDENDYKLLGQRTMSLLCLFPIHTTLHMAYAYKYELNGWMDVLMDVWMENLRDG